MYKFFKRTLDIVLSFLGMLVLSPFFLLLVLAIKLDSKGPVLFKQKRVGLHKKHFYILKFRTMRMDTPKDTPTHLLENPEQWITKVGKFLRKTSLDELPQIWNIFVGDMSIIGPRPALWNQYDLIEERDRYGANDVLPGLTGWAQIHGRDELPIAKKAELDGYYVQHLSFGLDVRCFFGTIKSVAKSEGVVEGGTGNMEKKD
ncbi:capsular polysaccharide biosynthesis protein Cps4E [Streptococcus sanguinis SK1 = NCTC 7863]|uniref:sugar transferase n=1 Tax=Streptococcus sanguinis TaxID=1305 RepID=UPI000204D41F|nr:sugar transferase [Streptococcus sanguinis]EGF06362.1 capsular polysaccharide biosynthesis protein Cps4E [Streptococcus sanguinis SK1 = NCTC 7863]KAF1306842.1 galactosyltransferase [Streptococcus sanguinis OH0843]MBZ2075320.1 sugar transferase [Streptococcus sanguinis]SQG29355.1 galactosyltransferase [Streptococcus sanguinis]